MEVYTRWLISQRWWVIAATFALLCAAGAGLQQLRYNPDLRVLYNPEHPLMQKLDEIESEFSKRDYLILVLAPEKGTVFTPRIAELMQQLTEDAWRLPLATRVDSLTNFQYTRADGDELIVSDLVPPGMSDDSDVLQAMQQVALSEPALKRSLVSEDGRVAALNIAFQARSHEELVAAMPGFVGQARSLLQQYQQDYPDVDFRLSGVHEINYALRNYTQRDSASLVPAMLLTMVLLLLLLLRSPYATFCSTLIVVATGVATMGLFGWLGLETEVVSVVAPIVIMTLAVADAVHLVNGAAQGKSLGQGDHQSVVYAVRSNVKPIFLTSLTTILGVITFSFTDFPPLKKLALIISVGVSIAFILSVTLLPALLSLRPVKPRANARSGPVLGRLADLTVGRARPILLCVAPLLLLAAVYAPQNVLDESPAIFFEESTPERQAIEFVEQHLGGVSISSVVFYGPASDSLYDPAVLAKLEQFTDWMRQQPTVNYVSSITDTMKRLNQNMHADQPEYYRLPEERELAAQYLLLYELSLPAGLELTDQLNIDKSGTLMTVVRENSTAATSVRFKHDIQQWVADNAPELRVIVSGMSQMVSELAYTYLIPSMLLGGSFAILTVSLVLFFALASVRLGLLGMLATCAPILMGYGFWAVYNGMMGFAIASVAGICLGIVVDFAIHFLSKYESARQQGRSAADSVHFAFETVARAIWITMIVLVAGFWMLTLSQVGLNSDLGLLTGIVILLAALFDLLVLPALLVVFDRRIIKPDSSAETSPAAI